MPPPPHASPQQHLQQQQQQQGYGAAGATNNTFLHTVLNTNTATHAHTATTGGRTTTTTQQQQQGQFSATQRSAQARGKEYTHLGRGEESYEVRQRREEAGRILESTEMLIWWSSARNESIPQTRRHFQNVVLGIEEFDKDVLWREEWEVEERTMASPRSAKGKERERRRVSSGLGAA